MPSTQEDRAAIDQLKRRRTDRRRPTSWPVARERLDGLLAQGPPAGATIVAVVSHRARRELLQILVEAERAQRQNPLYVNEVVRWTGRDDGEGVPDSSLLRRGPATGPDPTPSRFPSGTLPDHPAEAGPVEATLLLICTSSDDTASRLRAGEALGAVLLEATAAGLLAVPLTQAVEVDQTRHLLQDELLDDAACPQILVRVGWPPPAGGPIPPTPRRPVDDVLGDVGSLPARLGPYSA